MSCLFDSLSHFVQNINASELRKMIVDYLAKDPLIFDDLKEKGHLSDILQFENNQSVSLPQYIHHMSNSNAWGGAIEIRAFCEMFKARVMIKVYSDGKFIEFIPDTCAPTATFNLGYTGNHYEPISVKLE